MTDDRLASIKARIAALKAKQVAELRAKSIERAARLHARDPRRPLASSRIFIAPSRVKEPYR